MLEILIPVVVLILGIILMAFAGDKAVRHSVFFASASGIRPLMIGFFIVSIGTDFPEIINSIISSSIGHGNLNAGDSIGSVLTQITLVLGILAIVGKGFKINRREILTIGGCEILALASAYLVVEKGYFTRIDAALLIAGLPIYLLITHYVLRTSPKTITLNPPGRSRFLHISVAALGFIGVAIGSYLVIQSIISLAEMLNLPEYILSFFLMSIGTSLPELAVDLTAIRRKEFEVAIGDIIGSCVVDASLSISIGQLLFPQAVSADLATTTILYTIFASVVVISVLGARAKIDKKTGFLFIGLYAASYLMLMLW